MMVGCAHTRLASRWAYRILRAEGARMPASQVYGTRCLRPGFFSRRGLGGLCPPRFAHDSRRILRAEGARILRGRFELSGASDPDSSAGGASNPGLGRVENGGQVNRRGCQAKKPGIPSKTKNMRPKVSKGRSESPLAGRWGRAPSSKSRLFLEKLLLGMLWVGLTAPVLA